MLALSSRRPHDPIRRAQICIAPSLSQWCGRAAATRICLTRAPDDGLAASSRRASSKGACPPARVCRSAAGALAPLSPGAHLHPSDTSGPVATDGGGRGHVAYRNDISHAVLRCCSWQLPRASVPRGDKGAECVQGTAAARCAAVHRPGVAPPGAAHDSRLTRFEAHALCERRKRHRADWQLGTRGGRARVQTREAAR